MVENIMSRIYQVRKIIKIDSIFIISPHFLQSANAVFTASCIGIASFFKNRKKEQRVKFLNNLNFLQLNVCIHFLLLCSSHSHNWKSILVKPESINSFWGQAADFWTFGLLLVYLLLLNSNTFDMHNYGIKLGKKYNLGKQD